ncbi:Glutathione S-transferase theta-3 [Larimichthys crocea]|uniref:Glutathione S-transferase theta-3 n=1 Tax=Larimichthys crocea TaxID=215358 RepID=A0A6G0JBY2_LARCR|nr:Glutathione S-transferase theta-3 [Larimichthys crocea]
MALELYLDLYSQPCRSVYIFAKKNNIPFDLRRLSLLDGEQYGEEFGKINMIRKAPALRDGDFCLAESIAILLYLAEKFQTPDFWYPADLQQRARVNEYLSWQHMAIRMHGSKMFWLRLLIPKVLGVEVPQDKLDAALEDLNGSLKLIEENSSRTALHRRRPHLIGRPGRHCGGHAARGLRPGCFRGETQAERLEGQSPGRHRKGAV